MAETGWNLNGVDLRRVGYNIRTNAGWDGYPGSRLPQFSSAFRHGVRYGSKGYFQPKSMTITMDLFATDPDGDVTKEPEEHIQDNLDIIMGALYSRNRLVTLQKSRGTGPAIVRETQVAALTNAPIRAGFGSSGRRFAMPLEMPYPFWHELPIVNLVGLTGSPTVTNNGNAPIGDGVYTCTAAGRWTNADGEWMEVSSTAGGSVVIDTGAETILQGGSPADGLVSLGQEGFPDLEPGANGVTITGTWNLDHYHTYF